MRAPIEEFIVLIFGFVTGILIFMLTDDIQKQNLFAQCEEIKAQCREVLQNKVNQGGCK